MKKYFLMFFAILAINNHTHPIQYESYCSLDTQTTSLASMSIGIITIGHLIAKRSPQNQRLFIPPILAIILLGALHNIYCSYS